MSSLDLVSSGVSSCFCLCLRFYHFPFLVISDTLIGHKLSWTNRSTIATRWMIVELFLTHSTSE